MDSYKMGHWFHDKPRACITDPLSLQVLFGLVGLGSGSPYRSHVHYSPDFSGHRKIEIEKNTQNPKEIRNFSSTHILQLMNINL